MDESQCHVHSTPRSRRRIRFRPLSRWSKLPVVIDYAPQVNSGQFIASMDADMDLSWLDWIGIAAIGVGVVVSLRNRERKP